MVNQSNSDKMRLETESELCQVLIPLTSRYFKSQDINIKYLCKSKLILDEIRTDFLTKNLLVLQ